MTAHDELRLLPWSGPDGKPCFLSTDDPAGRLSRLADETETQQLGRAAELVAHGVELLSDEQTERPALERMAAALIEALQTTLRVATSRGHRLAVADLTPLEGCDPVQKPTGALD
ncbi:hypothetical protein [Streptomyces sp. NPDC051994]|uniref:hypothetical protein n=1 Tax=unclassified Streptomyces TaxID=2593676 RepID=UPI00344A04FF